MTNSQLRAALKKLDFSPTEFANQIGVARNTVNRWLMGSHAVPLWAQKYLKVLGELKKLRVLDAWVKEAIAQKPKAARPKVQRSKKRTSKR